MRKNEYTTLKEFTSQYTGEWNPPNGNWYGLDFSYHGNEYRFHTGTMYANENEVLENGKEVLFGLYFKNDNDNYTLLEQFATMDDVLESNVIENTPFKIVIMADETELLGQD